MIPSRVPAFCDRFGLRLPVLEAPMAGACPPGLAVAVAEAGGMGAAGVVMDPPERIAAWTAEFRDVALDRFVRGIEDLAPGIRLAPAREDRQIAPRFLALVSGRRPAPGAGRRPTWRRRPVG